MCTSAFISMLSLVSLLKSHELLRRHVHTHTQTQVCMNSSLQVDHCFGLETAVEEAQRAQLAAKVEASYKCLVKLTGLLT